MTEVETHLCFGPIPASETKTKNKKLKCLRMGNAASIFFECLYIPVITIVTNKLLKVGSWESAILGSGSMKHFHSSIVVCFSTKRLS